MSLKKKQKKLSRNLLIAGTIIISLLSNTAIAGNEAEIVKACDKALADQDKVVDLKNREVLVYKEIVAAQDTRIAVVEKDKNSIFSNPLLYVVVGLVAGGLLVRK